MTTLLQIVSIGDCHAGIRKIETRKVYKRRAIALAVIVVICTVIMVTPLSYIVKGFGHKMLGDYKAAINSYDQVEYLPGVGTMKKSCYYKIAKKYDDDNHHKKAMKVYRLATMPECAGWYWIKLC